MNILTILQRKDDISYTTVLMISYFWRDYNLSFTSYGQFRRKRYNQQDDRQIDKYLEARQQGRHKYLKDRLKKQYFFYRINSLICWLGGRGGPTKLITTTFLLRQSYSRIGMMLILKYTSQDSSRIVPCGFNIR